MFQLFLALFLAFSCPAHHNHTNTNGGVTTNADTGGESGHAPGNPTPPPPPPPNP